jgi:hypothetical protein
MLSIPNSAAMRRALESPVSTTLKTLLLKRKTQLSEHDEYDLGELAHFLIVQPGDSLATIEAELGFPITINLVDGVRFGHPDFMPSWEHAERHGHIVELTYIMDDSGFGWVILIEDGEGTDPEIRALCDLYISKDEA